jgi:phosphoglycolate phosphatase-like HAD superfamily hydrolase
MSALILFDIDGTILRAGDREHGAAFTHAFETIYGKPVTLEGVPLAGMLDAQIARVLFERHGLEPSEADTRLHEMMAAMGERYVAAIAARDTRERLLPGITEAILATIHNGWTPGVLTGNARSVGEAKLRAAGLDLLLTFGAWGDSAVERGHLVEVGIESAFAKTGVRFTPAQTVLIGDTPNDISAARLGGAHVIAVATGRFDTEALRHHDPDVIFPDLSDTVAFVSAVKSLVPTFG